jgi:hypothetical protein
MQSTRRSRSVPCKVTFSLHRIFFFSALSETFRSFPNANVNLKQFSKGNGIRDDSAVNRKVRFTVFPTCQNNQIQFWGKC